MRKLCEIDFLVKHCELIRLRRPCGDLLICANPNYRKVMKAEHK